MTNQVLLKKLKEQKREIDHLQKVCKSIEIDYQNCKIRCKVFEDTNASFKMMIEKQRADLKNHPNMDEIYSVIGKLYINNRASEAL